MLRTHARRFIARCANADINVSKIGCDAIVNGTITVADCVANPLITGRDVCQSGAFDGYPLAFCATGNNITQIGECDGFDANDCILNPFGEVEACAATYTAVRQVRIDYCRGLSTRGTESLCNDVISNICENGYSIGDDDILNNPFDGICGVAYADTRNDLIETCASTEQDTDKTRCDTVVDTTSTITVADCVADPYADGRDICQTQPLYDARLFYCTTGRNAIDVRECVAFDADTCIRFPFEDESAICNSKDISIAQARRLAYCASFATAEEAEADNLCNINTSTTVRSAITAICEHGYPAVSGDGTRTPVAADPFNAICGEDYYLPRIVACRTAEEAEDGQPHARCARENIVAAYCLTSSGKADSVNCPATATGAGLTAWANADSTILSAGDAQRE